MIMKNNSRVIKSGMWFTLSNFLMKTIGFITTPIFTRIMSKAEFGEFNNYQTWLMIILYITSFNLEGSLIRACHEFEDDSETYVFSMIVLSIVSTIIWWIIFNLFFEQIYSLLSVKRLYMNSMFLYLLFCPAVNLFQNAERFKYNYKWTVLTSMSISIGASLLSIIFMFLFEDKLLGRILGYIIPTIIVGMLIFIYYIKIAKIPRFFYWKYALKITIPYIPHLLSMFLLSNIDKIMIRKFCGSNFVALYSLAYTSGMLITIFVTSINNAFSPWLAEKMKKNEYKIIRKISFPYVMCFSFLAIGTVLLTPEILWILGGNSYMEARYVMAPVAAGCLLQFVYCMYVNIEQYEKKTIGMAFASILAALLNFLLNYIFIPQYGYIAAAYTTYIGYFFLLFFHMYLVKRIGKLYIYDNKKILIISIASSIVIFAMNFILDLVIIRYIIVLLYSVFLLIILYKFRDKMKVKL
ncbi:oligosaccharide flippase family protein [[Clostridium] innocuum]|nr:oligosaccharide flippase family protein [[Clostridium] innocuum]